MLVIANGRPIPGSGTRVTVNVAPGRIPLFGEMLKSNGVPSANNPERATPSPSSKMAVSPSIKLSTGVPLRKNSVPKTLTSLPEKALKFETVPPEMLIVLPEPMAVPDSKIPPERLIVPLPGLPPVLVAILPTTPPKMLSVPEKRPKSSSILPPVMLIVPPLASEKERTPPSSEILTVPPATSRKLTAPSEMLATLPVPTRKPSTVPPEMLTVLPKPDSKPSPIVPPEMLTSILLLEGSDALKV